MVFHLWYRGLVLSCHIQDDLSLYYNMVAANGKNMDPNARKVSANTRKFQQQKHTSYKWGADHPVTVASTLPGQGRRLGDGLSLPRTCGMLLRSAPHLQNAPMGIRSIRYKSEGIVPYIYNSLSKILHFQYNRV